MATEKKTGGPAFPIFCEDHRDLASLASSGYGGMTIRDYFAARAMQGEIAASAGNRRPAPDEVAEYAYQVADAMLAARENSND